MARIKLQRKKGWRIPADTVKVDRATRWGNPYKVTESRTAYEATMAFAIHLATMDPQEREALIAPLRGKNLACWCDLTAPCHADVWIQWAAGETPPGIRQIKEYLDKL